MLVPVPCDAHHHGPRGPLTTSQRGELVLVGEPLIAALAKEKQIRKPADSVLSTLTEQTEPINTRSTLADMAGVSHGTMHKIKVIAQKAAPDDAHGAIAHEVVQSPHPWPAPP